MSKSKLLLDESRREVTCTQDHWARTGRSHLVEDFKRDPDSVLVASDRLVFVSYDEQLYKDLKAHQDKRVAKMQRKKQGASPTSTSNS